MKIIFCITSSSNDIYPEFKKIWIKNIDLIKQSNLKDAFEFYFVYSESVPENHVNSLNYFDVYDESSKNTIPIHRSILFRNANFFKYCYKKQKYNTNDFFICTNLSSLFDFKKMYNWFLNKPTNKFFGGSINGFYNREFTTFSGMNMVMSSDIMEYIMNNYLKCDLSSFLEDEAISQLLLHEPTLKDLQLINIKRLDFIEMKEVVFPTHSWPATPNSIIYHKAKFYDDTIFSFRFKTFNRNNDIKNMNLLIENLYNPDFNLANYINFVSHSYDPIALVREESPEYSSTLSEIPFKILNLNNNKNLDISIENAEDISKKCNFEINLNNEIMINLN